MIFFAILMTSMWAKQRQSVGFTIVELLIVIVIIAILAAITIVAYNGIQDRAHTSAAASSSTQAAKKIKVWQVDNELTTPSCSQFYTLVTSSSSGAPTGTCAFDFKDTNYQYTGYSAGAFCITTTVVNKSYKVSDSTAPTAGGCAGHGQSGVAAVTNLAVDPSAVTNATNFSMMGTGYATFTSSIASDNAHNGTTSLKRSITGTGTIASKALLASTRINAGSQISWSLWVYSTRGGSISLHSEGTKVSDGTYTGCGGGGFTLNANTWTKLSATCTVTIDSYYSGAGAYGLNVQAGDSVWFDEYMVTASSTKYNYADGNSTDWAWNGTPNNSTSTGPPV